MPISDTFWGPVDSGGGAVYDLIQTTLPAVEPGVTLIEIQGHMITNGVVQAPLYTWSLDWRNASNQHLVEQIWQTCQTGGHVDILSGVPLNGRYYQIVVRAEGNFAPTDLAEARAIHTAGCEQGSPPQSLRGFTWCQYVDDIGRIWALRVDSGSAEDVNRGWQPVISADTPPFPRQWRPRRVLGLDAAGNQLTARVATLSAPLWTGGVTTFLAQTSDQAFTQVTVSIKEPETRLKLGP